MIVRLIFGVVFSACAVISASALLNRETVTVAEREALLALEPTERRARFVAFAESANTENLTAAGAFFAGEGETEQDQEKKIAAWCNALGAYGRAIALEPFKTRTLLNWANIRQLLGSTECSQAFTRGSFTEIAELALSEEPSSLNNRYIAGLLFSWNGDAVRAAEEFHTVLRYAVSLESRRREQIFAIASTPKMLRAIVPTRYPQGVDYLSWLRQQRAKGEYWSELLEGSEEYRLFRNELLENTRVATTDITLPAAVVKQWVERLETLEINVAERRFINQLLAVIHARDEESEMHALLNMRVKYDPIVGMYGVVGADTRAEKNPIVQWGPAMPATLDAYHNSIGIYLRAGDAPHLIEINCGEIGTIALQPGQLQVLTSDDNIIYKDVTSDIVISSVQNGRNALFAIKTDKLTKLTGTTGKYWKVHFNASSREAACRAPLHQLVSVYGKAGMTNLHEEL